MTTETFGMRLQRLRERNGMTPTELADAILSTAQSVNGWERGEYKPNANTYPKLARALGVTTFYLRWGRELSDVRLDIIEQRMRQALHDAAVARAS